MFHSQVNAELQPARLIQIMRISLIILWIGSGITSLFNWQQISVHTLQQQVFFGYPAHSWPNWLQHFIYRAAAIWDILLGSCLVSKTYRKTTYSAQLITIASYSLVATLGNYHLWLNPMGPLLKNLPLLAMTYFMLYQHQTSTTHAAQS